MKIQQLLDGHITPNEFYKNGDIQYLTVMRDSNRGLSIDIERKALPVIILPTFLSEYRDAQSSGELTITRVRTLIRNNIRSMTSGRPLKTDANFIMNNTVFIFETEDEAIECYYEQIEYNFIDNMHTRTLVRLVREYDKYQLDKQNEFE